MMTSSIESFWNILFRRDIVKKEELLREAIRVIKTRQIAEEQGKEFSEVDKEALFQFMKENTEEKKLGFFPGDRDFFAELFFAGQNLHIIDFAIETYKNDYTGTILSPEYLTIYLKDYFNRDNVKNVLINEAEKFLVGLEKIINTPKEKNITLTTSNYLMNELFKLAFRSNKNVEVYHASLYLPLEFENKFDLILSIPAFGGKISDMNFFMTNDTPAIALENQIHLLEDNGILVEVVPASFTFSSNTSVIRQWIANNYSIYSILSIPEGTFRPYTGIKTYLLTIKNHKKEESIQIGKLKLDNGTLITKEAKSICRDDLEMYEDWRIELMLAEDKSEIKKFKESNVSKVKMKDIAEVFRGKSIMKNDLMPGDIYVLNISNIEDGQIIAETMETINEDERKVKRYELIENDLVMTCRGTVNKVAVVKEKNKKIIASANIIVIRFKEKILSDYVKIFLESPIGIELIKTFQRGTTVMNINPKDIGELEIPMVEYDRQLEIVGKYQNELNLYQETVKNATERWNLEKNSIYNSLV